MMHRTRVKLGIGIGGIVALGVCIIGLTGIPKTGVVQEGVCAATFRDYYLKPFLKGSIRTGGSQYNATVEVLACLCQNRGMEDVSARILHIAESTLGYIPVSTEDACTNIKPIYFE